MFSALCEWLIYFLFLSHREVFKRLSKSHFWLGMTVENARPGTSFPGYFFPRDLLSGGLFFRVHIFRRFFFLGTFPLNSSITHKFKSKIYESKLTGRSFGIFPSASNFARAWRLFKIRRYCLAFTYNGSSSRNSALGSATL